MEGMIGEIRMFGGNFAPRAWALCDGQLLPISQNTALFSILGTIYGGDGRTTFALPDIRGRFVMGPGNGPGLSSWREGQKTGAETETMTINKMPGHDHSFSFPASDGVPILTQASTLCQLTVVPQNGDTATAARYSVSNNGSMHQDAFVLSNTGGGQSYDIIQPFTVINYVICLQGVFPSRS